MKQPFDFTGAAPPPLDGRALRAELARRRERRAAALLAAGSLLALTCLALAAVSCASSRPRSRRWPPRTSAPPHRAAACWPYC